MTDVEVRVGIKGIVVSTGREGKNEGARQPFCKKVHQFLYLRLSLEYLRTFKFFLKIRVS